MPRFQIELRTESHVSETLDLESANHTELRIEVARFVGELLGDHAQRIWEDEEWRVDVTDERGLILYTMMVAVTESAATARLNK